MYSLSGKGTEPLAEGHIVLETQVWREVWSVRGGGGREQKGADWHLGRRCQRCQCPPSSRSPHPFSSLLLPLSPSLISHAFPAPVCSSQARKAVSRSFTVPNIVGAPVEYAVMTDLDMVAGPQTLKCSPNAATSYKVRSGESLGLRTDGWTRRAVTATSYTR